ncbi:MAG: DUF6261 family protein [Mangrovibacterium sp.]
MKTLLLASSLNTEVSSVGSLLDKRYVASTLSSDTYLATTFADLGIRLFSMNEAIKRSKAASELEVKDNLRDTVVRRLFSVIEGAADTFVEPEQSAGQQLAKILAKYGLGLTRESYATETALINSLLIDLDKAEVQQSIAAIRGCAEGISQLIAVETDFETSQASFEATKGNEAAYTNASAQKQSLINFINEKVVAYINGSWVPAEAPYIDFAAAVNQIIADNNTAVRRRLNANKNKRKDNDEEKPEE